MEKIKLVRFPVNSKKAPAVPAGTDWADYTGKVDSAMWGIAVPDHVLIVDLDTYKGATRELAEAAIGCALPWDEALLQDTVNGGQHYAFFVPCNTSLKNLTNALGMKGLDTRSAGKGYIATGEGYTDMTLFGVEAALSNPDLLPELPAEAISVFSDSAVVAIDGDDSTDLDILVASRPLEISTEEVDLYLSKLTPEQAEDSDTWFTVMAGLKHQFAGSAEGWERFDTFSKMSPSNYNQRENKKRWDSIGGKTNPITFASVIKLAGGQVAISLERAEGLAERVAACEDMETFNGIVQELSKSTMGDMEMLMVKKHMVHAFKRINGDISITLPQLDKLIRGQSAKAKAKHSGSYADDFVFLTCTGEYMNRTNKTRMGPRSFDVAMGRETPPDHDGNDVAATTYVRDKIEVVHDGMYAPHLSGNDDIFEYCGVRYANTYIPNDLERVPHGSTDIVQRVLNHIDHLLADKKEQRIFLNYLAHNVQHPGKKIYWAILLQGVEGDGKSFFAEMMKHVMGHQNAKSIGADSLDEKFTPWAEGSCLTFVEEVKLNNIQKHEVINKIKPYITNPVVNVRRMRTDVYEAINTTNYIMFTNFPDALPLNDNDRRYCIMFSRWQDKRALQKWMAENENYYSELYADMRNNAGEILDFLLTHKIDDEFMGMLRAPESDAKRKMIEASRSDAADLVEDFIAEFECHDINNEVVNITKLSRLVDTISEDHRVKDFPKTSRLRNVMLELGYHSIGRYKDENRKHQAIYAKDSTAKASDFKEQDPDYVPF